MATIMSQDVQFTAFCKILNFVNELNNVFGSKYFSIIISNLHTNFIISAIDIL